MIGALIGATDNEATRVETQQARYRTTLERDGVIVTIEAESGQEEKAMKALDETGAENVAVLQTA